MKKEILVGGSLGLILGYLEGSKELPGFSEAGFTDGEITKPLLIGIILGFFCGIALMGGKERNVTRFYGISFSFMFTFSVALVNVFTHYNENIINSLNLISTSAFGASIGCLAASFARHS